ncbi:MAG: hypothetical protein ACRC5A_15010 [Enterobacteriaceae bacterium]
MAMVISSLFLPDNESIELLTKLSAPVEILESPGLYPNVYGFLLAENDGHSLHVSTTSNDVRFKFECFIVEINPGPPEYWGEERLVEKLGTGFKITCLFRFEWERPPYPGEVPLDWEQIVGQRGKRKEIPKNIMALGASMVGLLLEDDSHTLLIGCDDEVPETSRIYRDTDEINAFIDECESVVPDKVPEWCEEVRSWRDAFVVTCTPD